MFAPIFKEMKDLNCTLNLEEFIDASNNLFKELTVLQKDEFMDYYKSLGTVKKTIKDPMYEECSFKVLPI